MTSDQNEFRPESAKVEGAAAAVGACLREVRERLSWKLPDIAAQLRIREMFLAAIESGDLSSLPGPAYRAGFVRAYAQVLGLDGEEILQRFRAAGQMGEVARPELQLLEPVPDRAVPASTIIFVCLLVIIAGYGLWYYHTEHLRKLAESVPHVPPQLQPLTPPKKVEPPKATPAPKPVPRTTVTATAASSASAPASALVPAPAPGAVPPSSAATTPPATTSAAPATATATAPAAPAKATPIPGAGMVITATQEAWIQVTTPNGTILFSKVLNPGQSWPVPQMPGLKMTTGNAGGTVISTNGVAGQPLGAAGVVLRGYQLTPSAPAGMATPTQAVAPEAATTPTATTATTTPTPATATSTAAPATAHPASAPSPSSPSAPTAP